MSRLRIDSTEGRTMKRWIILWSLGAVFLTIGWTRAEEPQLTVWRGKVEKKGSLTIVSNPKNPLYPSDVFRLKEDMSIGAAGGVKDYSFFRAWYIVVDEEGNIYVMDAGDTCVKIYDDHGKYLSSVGRKGQGPGELQNPNSIHLISGNRLVFEDFYRCLNIYAKEGQFINSRSTANLGFIDVLVTPENRIVARVNAVTSGQNGKELRVYDGQLKLLRTLLFMPEEPHDRQVARPFAGGFHLVLSQFDRAVVCYKDDYEIEIHDIRGDSNMCVRKEYDRIKITKEEIDEVTKKMRGRRIDIPAYHPAVQGISGDDEGRIYVKTFERTKDGVSFYYDVFDREGRYLVKVPILRSAAPQVWKNRKMYCLEQDEDGFQKVKRYSVLWQIPN